MPPCPFCDSYVGLASKRCASCSRSLELACPRCGFSLPGLVTRCVRCRARLTRELWAEALAADEEEASPERRPPALPERQATAPERQATAPKRKTTPPGGVPTGAGVRIVRAEPGAKPASRPVPRTVTPVADPLVGQVLDGRYAVEKKVGSGGMGTVYRGVQTAMERSVAIKVLLPSCAASPDQVARFMAEARTASQLLSPNTVTIHDFGRAPDGRLYLVMEYLAGRSLTELVETEGALPWRRALHIVRQAATSLQEAHAKGFLHRDIKPDNIMLVELNNDPDFVKVLDFGIAKSLNEAAKRLTATGAVLGTPTYMSPEQARDDGLDARSDLYSLGVVLFEALAGRPPFVAETPMSVLLKHCTEEPPDLATLSPDAEVPPPLQALLASLLAKSPEQRPDSASDLVLRCEELLESPSPGRTTTPSRGTLDEAGASQEPAVGGRGPSRADARWLRLGPARGGRGDATRRWRRAGRSPPACRGAGAGRGRRRG